MVKHLFCWIRCPVGSLSDPARAIPSRRRYSPADMSVESHADRAWKERHERLWAEALRIVAEKPELDVSGVCHALCNLERTPEERLRKGLLRGRLRAD
jgi:hypothetical protein